MEAVWTESVCRDQDGYSPSVSSFTGLTLAIRASSSGSAAVAQMIYIDLQSISLLYCLQSI